MSDKPTGFRFAKLFTLVHPDHGVIHLIFRRVTGKLLHGCYTDPNGNVRELHSLEEVTAVLDELESKVTHA